MSLGLKRLNSGKVSYCVLPKLVAFRLLSLGKVILNNKYVTQFSFV